MEMKSLSPPLTTPLWTAAVTLAGGNAIHYLCDEAQEWQPDIEDIARKNYTEYPRYRGSSTPTTLPGLFTAKTVLRQIVALAKEHDLIIYADEIYDRILYDDAEHIPLGKLATDVLCITLNGLSKNLPFGRVSFWLDGC